MKIFLQIAIVLIISNLNILTSSPISERDKSFLKQIIIKENAKENYYRSKLNDNVLIKYQRLDQNNGNKNTSEDLGGISYFFPISNITYYNNYDFLIHYKLTSFEKLFTDSVICLKVYIIKDAAIGFHDNYNTSSNNYNRAVQSAAYTIPGSFGGLNTNRAVMQFNIPDFIDSVNVLSVKLNLFATGPIGNLSGHTGSNNSAVLQKIIEYWDENTVSWDNQPKSSSEGQTFLVKSSYSNQDYMNIDIYDLFKEIQLINNGIILKLNNEIVTNALIFCSADHPDRSKHPYVEICYINKKEIVTPINDCTFSIFPIPTFSELYYSSIQSNLTFQNKLEIFTTTGQLVKVLYPNESLYRIDTDYLSAGLYILKSHQGNCINTSKFIVLK